MSRCGLAFLLVFVLSGNALAKCGPPDPQRLSWTRVALPKSVPPGLEVFDRIWLKNPTSTEFITYTVEKGAEARTNYREILGSVPTTKDELPGMKLVNGERYEYHFPENPVYHGDQGKAATRGGWVHQDYPAGLIEPSTPIIPPALEERIFSGKTKIFAIKVPVLYYLGKKRGKIEIVFEFTKNPKFGQVAPGCPMPSDTPSLLPSFTP
jgi:hypothetical protein